MAMGAMDFTQWTLNRRSNMSSRPSALATIIAYGHSAMLYDREDKAHAATDNAATAGGGLGPRVTSATGCHTEQGLHSRKWKGAWQARTLAVLSQPYKKLPQHEHCWKFGPHALRRQLHSTLSLAATTRASTVISVHSMWGEGL